MKKGPGHRAPLSLDDLPSPAPAPKSLQTMIPAIVAGVGWSDPIPLTRTHIDAHIPACGGIYQVSFATKESVLPPALEGRLGYVGQSGNLRRRCRELLRSLASEQMPFTNPHFGAPCLWVWLRLFPQVGLQVCCFPLFEEEGYSAYWRCGIEDLALALHRQHTFRHIQEQHTPLAEGWFSPVANFGFFPSGWRSSTNFKRGRRGGPLRLVEEEGEQDRFKHGPDVPPAMLVLFDQQQHAAVLDPVSQLWGGYHWSAWEPARAKGCIGEREQVGLYRLAQPDCNELLFVGSAKLAEAARKASRLDERMLISSVSGSWGQPQLLAQVSDLCGFYLWQRHSLPLLQYGGPERLSKSPGQTLLQPPLWRS